MEGKMKAVRDMMDILEVAIRRTCWQWLVLGIVWMVVEIILYGETRPDMADSLIGIVILYIMLKANYAKIKWQIAERKLQDAARCEAYGMGRK